MGNCENCKHWNREHLATVDESWGAKIKGMAGCLNSDRLINPDKPLILSNADAPDDGFMTSPDFGCNQFETL